MPSNSPLSLYKKFTSKYTVLGKDHKLCDFCGLPRYRRAGGMFWYWEVGLQKPFWVHASCANRCDSYYEKLSTGAVPVA